MNTLFAKLSVALLLIVALVGTAFFFVERFSTRAYYEELTQRLNAPIAMYVTGEKQLFAGGEPNGQALQALAEQAMVINPTVEVYLLDAAGKILAHSFPEETVLTASVELAPVLRLLAGEAALPLRGTDPRNPNRMKVFSAAEVRDGAGRLQGYLYAVLGGQKYDELADNIRGSYTQELALWALVVIVATGFLVGLMVLGLLTRRLTRLTTDVLQYTDSGFDPQTMINKEPGGEDEIDRLRGACAVMSQKIQDQFDTLKETDRLRRDLISNVSHDLRTPLASMQGYVETLLIKDANLSAQERRRYLEITRKHTKRLAGLVSDLFELSKLESAQVAPRFEAFSLAELLQDTTQEFELEALQRKIDITVQGDPAESVVFADIGLVQRVLENLLRNALKFTPTGGRITIDIGGDDQRVAVGVTDTGCGIPDAEVPRIFDRFYRAENGEEAQATSSGLGLAIVKRILDLHGSRITVTSKLNQGTRFEFDLPARQAA